MLQTKPSRLEIALALVNPFDYIEFAEACQRQEIEPLTIGEYAQKIGMVQVALVRFPKLTPEQAYLEFIGLMNQIAAVASPAQSSGGSSCGSCGGGSVL